ncbi:tripartite motif-containing 13-like [Strongylocentrotus purpuratus]|uniref:RING-type domain-containing protein n=1 Tax=Strongylocentrotus purpuratus TaxID=7668 RepID=A0A7M7PCA0_STRPU|nr:tripartite motif-containing 13-like [Strongylocentrotus purpuratus]
MAKKIALQVPESLACPLCLDAFKAPTLLACGHTFCKVCLDKYDSHHRGQDFMECPVCKKRTKLDKNRVAGLAPNFSVKGLEEELHVHLKVNGKSELCALHSQVYKDILCAVCKEFICLTCLFDKHQGHMFKKKEELEAELKKERKSVIQKSEKKKAQIKKSVTNAEQQMRYMYSHLENLEREVDGSFRKKSEILLRHKERLSKQINDIRTKSGKVMTDFIGRQKHSLQNMNVKCTLMEQEGNASTSTGKVSDSDALKLLYMEFTGLKQELEKDLNDPPITQEVIENTRFRPSDENDLDLGTLNWDASESEDDSDQGSQEASESEDDFLQCLPTKKTKDFMQG